MIDKMLSNLDKCQTLIGTKKHKGDGKVVARKMAEADKITDDYGMFPDESSPSFRGDEQC